MNSNQLLSEVRRTWSPPREVAGGGPREVRISGTGIVIAILATVFLAAALVGFVLLRDSVAREVARLNTWKEQGVDTTGAVVRLWKTGDKEPRHMVAYRFSIGGARYTGEAAAPERIWQSLTEGASIVIRVVPATPALNHPSDWDMDVLPAFVPYLVLAIFGGGGTVLMILLRGQNYLLREGQAAPAIITRLSRNKQGMEARYEFTQFNGAVIKGRGSVRQSNLSVGSGITVIYDPDNPRRNTPYPVEFWKVRQNR